MAKKKYEPDYNACFGKHDKFGSLYSTMASHDAFKNMPIGLRMFYVICRVQANSGRGRQCLFKHGEDYGIKYNPVTDFVFPTSHLQLYGYDKGNASRYFRELQKRGFIDIKECNKNLKHVNVYSFSDRWKNTS